MTGSEIVTALILTGFVGFVAGRCFVPKAPPVPLLDRLTEGDIREVIRKLRPLTRHNMPTDIGIHIYADGEIHLHATLLKGSEIRATGDTLDAVRCGIAEQATEIAEALS